MNKNIWIPVLIVCLGFVIYGNSFNVPFQFDDQAYILKNPMIRDITNLKALVNSFSGHRRSVGLLTFALNYHFYRYDVFGYHLINTIIHIINAFLVWWLLQLIFRSPKLKGHVLFKYRGSIALIASVLFLTHPLQTQAVTYITQRLASLATMFYLLGCCFYLKARLAENGIKKIIFYGVCAIAALLGIYTKEIVFSIPFCLILIEGVFFVQPDKAAFIKKALPILFIFILILGVIFGRGLTGAVFTQTQSHSHIGDTLTNGTYLMTQFRVISTYLKLLTVPLGQNLDYDFIASTYFFESMTFFSFLFLLGLILLGFKLRRDFPLITFGIFFFFIALSVESSFIPQMHVIFEHRLYLPSIGFFIALTSACYYSALNRKVVTGGLITVIVLLSVLTIQRNKIWQSEISLWSDVVKKSPQKARGYNNLGSAYLKLDQHAKAMEYFDKAVSLNPQYEEGYLNKGVVHYHQGQYSQALKAFDQALQIKPFYNEVFFHRGYVYMLMQQYDRALKEYTQLLKSAPFHEDAIMNRGIIYGLNGRAELAIADFNRAIQLNPHNASAYSNRGLIYTQRDQWPRAIADFSRAIELNPAFNDAYYNRALAYKHMGEKEKALADARMLKKLGENIDLSQYQ